MRFADPSVLVLLLLVPLVYWRGRRPGPGGVFSSLALLPRVTTWRQALAGLPLILRCLALALVVVALARPQSGLEQVREISHGVALEMVVDRSGSMGSEMEYNGRTMTRLAVVKEVFSRFVNGDGKELKGRPQDLIGVISFARYADTICPLTLAHDAVNRFLDTIHLVPEKSPENKTAIGDAVALAAARLQKAGEAMGRAAGKGGRDYTIKSKVIILLTDGENNAGRHSPAEAAALAAKWGIRIYTIAVAGDTVRRIDTIFGPRTVRVPSTVDTSALQAMADKTGGAFYLATDADSLRRAYAAIDHLEKSEVESVRYLDYREHFQPLAAVALALLAVEALLRATWLRRLP